MSDHENSTHGFVDIGPGEVFVYRLRPESATDGQLEPHELALIELRRQIAAKDTTIADLQAKLTAANETNTELQAVREVMLVLGRQDADVKTRLINRTVELEAKLAAAEPQGWKSISQAPHSETIEGLIELGGKIGVVRMHWLESRSESETSGWFVNYTGWFGQVAPFVWRPISAASEAQHTADQQELARLKQALAALGVMPEGYCFCPDHRDATKPKEQHTGECREARQLLAKESV